MNKPAHPPLNFFVRQSIEQYFNALNGEQPGDVYEMVIKEVERPLLEVVMREVNGNQSQAARILGINRNTLRKKLKRHRLSD